MITVEVSEIKRDLCERGGCFEVATCTPLINFDATGLVVPVGKYCAEHGEEVADQIRGQFPSEVL